MSIVYLNYTLQASEALFRQALHRSWIRFSLPRAQSLLFGASIGTMVAILAIPLSNSVKSTRSAKFLISTLYRTHGIQIGDKLDGQENGCGASKSQVRQRK